MKIAVIDLGTNSIRFDIYELKSDLKAQLTYRTKKMVRIGEKVFKSKKLSEKAMARTIAAVKDYSAKIKEQNIGKVIAFSTCALREAKNAAEFVKKLEFETDIKIKVISGKEEARLISKGILSNEDVPRQGTYALVDIGGGSTEISLCYKRTVLEQDSLALGSSRLTQMFCSQSPLPVKNRKEMRAHIKEQLLKFISSEVWNSAHTLMCSSGTAKAFIKIAAAQGMNTNPLSLSDLNKIISGIKNLDTEELLEYPGMEPKRVDIIVAGGILLQEIARVIGAKKIILTDYNLRDGIIEEELESYLKKQI